MRKLLDTFRVYLMLSIRTLAFYIINYFTLNTLDVPWLHFVEINVSNNI